MWTFSCPTIVCGDHALDYLHLIQDKKAFVVTEKELTPSGLIQRVTDQVMAAGTQCLIFDQVENELNQDVVERGGRMIGEYQPDWIIALGSRVCMDTAKSITRQLANGGRAAEKQVRFMAIPVTMDSDSDILPAHDETQILSMAEHLSDIPDVAILAPEMYAHLSLSVIAEISMGALCKAIEGYTSPWGSCLTDGPTLMASRLVIENLPLVSQQGEEGEARNQLQRAAFLAELASSQAPLAGLAQCAAGALSITHMLPFGIAAGLMLPYAMMFLINGSIQTTGKYAEIARFCGLTHDASSEGALSLVTKIQTCAAQLGHPTCLRTCIADSEQFEATLPEMVTKILS